MSSRSAILTLVCLQAAFVLWFWPGFLTDWDSYLYSYAALNFEPVSLGFGRWFYCALLGVVWQIARTILPLNVGDSWCVFAIVSVAAALANVLLFYGLARRWTNKNGAFVAGCLFATSPLVACYAVSVMTETLTLTLLLSSVIVLAGMESSSTRARSVVISGLLFGAACSIREPVMFFSPLYLALLCRGQIDLGPRVRRVLLFGFLTAMVIFLGWFGAYLAGSDWLAVYRSWRAGMLTERGAMVGSFGVMAARNVFVYVAFLVLFSPIVVLAIPEQIRWLRSHGSVWSRGVIAGIALYTVAEVLNHTLIFNPRFVIFPGVLLSIFAGGALADRLRERRIWHVWTGLGIAAFHVALVVLSLPVLETYHFGKSRSRREAFSTLDSVPDRSILIPGRLTPVVEYHRRLHGGRWRIVYSGWAFRREQIDQAAELCRTGGYKMLLVEPKHWPSATFRPAEHEAYAALYHGNRTYPSKVKHFVVVRLDGDQATTRRYGGTSPPPAASRPVSTGDD